MGLLQCAVEEGETTKIQNWYISTAPQCCSQKLYLYCWHCDASVTGEAGGSPVQRPAVCVHWLLYWHCTASVAGVQYRGQLCVSCVCTLPAVQYRLAGIQPTQSTKYTRQFCKALWRKNVKLVDLIVWQAEEKARICGWWGIICYAPNVFLYSGA